MVMKKKFWPKKQIKITQKNFHVNRMSSLQDLDRVTPPQKHGFFGGGGFQLIFDLIRIHLSMFEKISVLEDCDGSRMLRMHSEGF